MSLSRREFVRRFGAGGAALASASTIIGYGREDLLAFTGHAELQRGGARPGGAPAIRGPSPKLIEVLKSHPSRDLGLG